MASWVVFANAKIISGRRIFLSPLNRLILRHQPDESSEYKEAKKDNRWCWNAAKFKWRASDWGSNPWLLRKKINAIPMSKTALTFAGFIAAILKFVHQQAK